ncbi:MAG: PRC-barrel domain-containing protein [Actinobacteria bacterium]|nr:PRC-barrel domain-containing protein [Actinomycetota bacterium]
MSELRVGATIEGTDGDLGTLDALIVDPINRRVTHLVVSHDKLSPRVLVPAEAIKGSTPDAISLALDRDGLCSCPTFDLPDFNEPDDTWTNAQMALDPGSYYLQPFASPLDGWVLATHEHVPKGEVSVRRGSEVFTSDGTKVGHVDEFLVDPSNGQLTHVVLRRGHVFRHDDDVVIPLTNAATMKGSRVVLDLDLHQVDALERIPVKRHGHVRDSAAPT